MAFVQVTDLHGALRSTSVRDNITIEAELTDSVYLKSESAFLLFRRINTSPERQALQRTYVMHNLYIELSDGNGKRLQHTGLQLSLVGPLTETFVEPGDTVLDVVNLSSEFGRPTSPTAWTKSLAPGHYDLIVHYSELNNPGPLTMPNIGFSVTEPAGQEFLAFQAWDAFETVRSNEGRQAAREVLYNFVNRFAESRYFGDVCHMLSVLDGARAQDWSRLLIEKSPNSGNTYLAFLNLISPLDARARKSLCLGISQKYSGTLVTEIARNFLQVDYHEAQERRK